MSVQWSGKIDSRLLEAHPSTFGTIVQDRKSGVTQTLSMPYETFKASLEQWSCGALIQRAFPLESLDAREFIMNGSAWDEILGPEEDQE
jgi:hypothetical protein